MLYVVILIMILLLISGTGEMAVGEDFIVEADENYQINTLQFQGAELFDGIGNKGVAIIPEFKW